MNTEFQFDVWSFFRPKAGLEHGNCKLPKTDTMYILTERSFRAARCANSGRFLRAL